jgi:parvulin-like peptidyl-prolyl isomerase
MLNFKKLIFTGLLTLITFSQAKMVNAIAMTVNGEPITTAEIRNIQQKARVTKQQAIDLLVQDRLQNVAMKKITVPESDIDLKISQIATQNNLTVSKMQKLLKAQGTSWTVYRKTVKDGIKKQKFYKSVVATSIPGPSEDELKLFYQNHKKLFVIPKSIKMVEYSSSSESKLKKFLQTKNTSGIKSKSVTKSTSSINKALLGKILQTQNGSFTRPLNAGDKYITYKIISKSGQTNMSFESAKNAVAARWKQEQQGKVLKDYFEKMKTEADIRKIR